MTLPPIVERELRVAARRRSTFRLRFLAALAAAGVGSLFVLASALPGWVAPSGRPLFVLLSAAAFGLALLAGSLLTADCLSREKRDGTLGFLFLTDLNGFDVVAGKFAALSLVPLHGMLAVLPIAAMTVFMGGVTGVEFWRVSVVVVNTLFLSLAAGMLVSSVSTEDRKAVGWALALTALGVAGPPLVARLAGLSPIGWASPAVVFHAALGGMSGPRAAGFWWAIGLQHALGWLLLAVAATIVRRVWRTKEIGRGGGRAWVSGAAGPAAARRFTAAEAVVGPGWQGNRAGRAAWWMAGLVVVTAVVVFGWMAVERQRFEAGPRSMLVANGGFHLLKLLLAIQVVHALQDSCRSGAMELLLVTPVSGTTLWAGHFAAMRRMVTGPFVVLAVVQLGLVVSGRFLAGGDWPSVTAMVGSAVGWPLVGVVIHGLDLAAVGFHASRWALHYDRPWKALLRTTLGVLVLPVLFCGHARVVVDLFIIARERPRLERFREVARRWFFPGPWGSGVGMPRA